MKKFWQTEKFKRIERVWEEKLRQSGFNDIENAGKKLKQNAGNSYRTVISTVIDGKQRYFELLSQHFHDEVFTDEIERFVMERRSQGAKIKEIVIDLKGMGVKRRTHRETIRLIIQSYENKWKIKKR